MRITEFARPLVEKTTENMNVLADCADVIIAALPPRIDEPIVHFRIRDVDYLHEMCKKLQQKYAGTSFEEALRIFPSIEVVFENFRVTGVAGAYIQSGGTRKLMFNIAALTREVKTRSKDDLLIFRNDELPIKTFRAIAIHEIRHFFQSIAYAKYYDKHDEEYRKAPIEIDAAWYHHLEDYSVAEYSNVSEYVDDVMKSFLAYKDLDDKQKAHYRRKTARYFFDRQSGDGDDYLSKTAPHRLVDRRAKAEDDRRRTEAAAVAEIMAALVIPKTNMDLRNIDGYDPNATRFFFPDHLPRAVAVAVGKREKVDPSLAPIVLLTIGLGFYPRTASPRVVDFLRTVLGLTRDDALAGADATFSGFDVRALKAMIERVFPSG